jgi:hypothetical protein
MKVFILILLLLSNCTNELTKGEKRSKVFTNLLKVDFAVGGDPACGGRPLTTALGFWGNDINYGATIIKPNSELVTDYLKYLNIKYNSSEKSKLEITYLDARLNNSQTLKTECRQADTLIAYNTCNNYVLQRTKTLQYTGFALNEVTSIEFNKNTIYYLYSEYSGFYCDVKFKIRSVNL